MSVVSVTYKLIFGNMTIYFTGLFSPSNVLIPQCENILKQIPRKRGFFFWFQERFEYFILPNQSPSAEFIYIYMNIFQKN